MKTSPYCQFLLLVFVAEQLTTDPCDLIIGTDISTMDTKDIQTEPEIKLVLNSAADAGRSL